jgi:hypothetical protein
MIPDHDTAWIQFQVVNLEGFETVTVQFPAFEVGSQRLDELARWIVGEPNGFLRRRPEPAPGRVLGRPGSYRACRSRRRRPGGAPARRSRRPPAGELLQPGSLVAGDPVGDDERRAPPSFGARAKVRTPCRRPAPAAARASTSRRSIRSSSAMHDPRMLDRVGAHSARRSSRRPASPG